MNITKKKTALILALALTVAGGSVLPSAFQVSRDSVSAEETVPQKSGEFRGLKYEVYNNTAAITGVNYKYTENDSFIKYEDGYSGNSYCTTSITIPDEINGYPVTEIKCKFEYGELLKEIILGKNVLTIQEEAFYNYWNNSTYFDLTLSADSNNYNLSIFGNRKPIINQINIPSYAVNAAFVENTDWSNLKAVEVSEGNTKYSSVDGIFYTKDQSELILCPPANSLIEINIPDATKSIRAGAFKNANLPSSLNLGKNVKNIGDEAFYHEEAVLLTSLTLPSSLVESAIGENAFKNVSFSELTIPDYTKYISDDFLINSKTKEFSVSADNALYSSDADGVLYNKDMTKLIKVPAAFATTTYDVPEGVASIEEGAFTNTMNPTYVSLPQTLGEIGKNTDTKIRTVEGYDNTPASEWANQTLNAKYISNGPSDVSIVPEKNHSSYDVNQDGVVNSSDLLCLVQWLVGTH